MDLPLLALTDCKLYIYGFISILTAGQHLADMCLKISFASFPIVFSLSFRLVLFWHVYYPVSASWIVLQYIFILIYLYPFHLISIGVLLCEVIFLFIDILFSSFSNLLITLNIPLLCIIWFHSVMHGRSTHFTVFPCLLPYLKPPWQ